MNNKDCIKDEEAATGMAAGPLGCYLIANNFTTGTELTIKQGEYMSAPLPSLITLMKWKTEKL